MSAISIFAIAVLCFLVFMLMIKNKKIQSDKYLAAFLVTIIIGVFNDVLFYEFPAYREFFILGNMTVPLCATFLYMYIKSLISPFSFWHVKNLALLLPPLFILIFNFYMPEYEIIDEGSLLLISLYYSVKLGYAIIILIVSKVQLLNYRKRLKQNLSYIEKVDFNWLHLILNISFGLFAIVFVLIGFYLGNVITSISYLISFISVAVFVFIILLAYHGIKNTNNFYDIATNNHLSTLAQDRSAKNGNLKNRESEEAANQAIDEKLKERLLKTMEEDKPHLTEKLTITQLSEKTNISQKQLSHIINTHFNYNFFDFINSYRIKEFNRKIEKDENKNFTILSLALECGFSSKSAFNRAYKKLVGVPPSAFQKSGTN